MAGEKTPLLGKPEEEDLPPSSCFTPTFSTVSNVRPSPTRAKVMIATAATFGLLLSGLVFGWAPMQQMLLNDGVYSYLCTNHTDPLKFLLDDPDSSSSPSHTKVAPCPEQTVRFNLIFVASTTLFSCMCLPLGPFLDYYGPLATSTLGSLTMIVGFALVGLSTPEFDAFLWGFIGISVGGYTVLFSFYHLGNLFPEYQGTIITIFSVSLDSSSIVFLILQIIHNAFDLTYHDIFFGYIIFPLLNLVLGVWLWPSKSYPVLGNKMERIPEPESEEEEYPINFTKEEFLKPNNSFKKDEDKKKFDPRNSDLTTLPYLLQTFKSMEFWLSASFLCLCLLRCNWYIGTVFDQLGSYSDNDDKVSLFTTIFVLILPIGGVLSVPAVGYLIDYQGIIVSVFTVAICGFLWGVFTLLEFLPIFVQICTFLLVAFYRALLYSAMTTYFFSIYGEKRFGLVFGTVAFFAGLINLAEYFLVRLVVEVFNKNFFWVNLALTAVAACLFSFPIYIKMKQK